MTMRAASWWEATMQAEITKTMATTTAVDVRLVIMKEAVITKGVAEIGS